MDILIRLLADGLVLVVVLIAGITIMLSVKKPRYQTYTQAFMAGQTAYVVAKIMSLFYQTLERPFVALGVEPRAAYLDNPGFPSDHALFVMTITLITFAITKNKVITIVLFLLACAVGVGRVVALVHTPQDVIGGYVAALFGVGLWYGFFILKK